MILIIVMGYKMTDVELKIICIELSYANKDSDMHVLEQAKMIYDFVKENQTNQCLFEDEKIQKILSQNIRFGKKIN